MREHPLPYMRDREKALRDVVGEESVDILQATGAIPQQDVRDLLPLRLRRSGGRLEEDYEAVVENWESTDGQ